MKKILYLMAALAIFAVSCTKPEPVKPSITLSTPADVTVPTDGGIQTVSFTSNVPWTASIDNSNWSVSPASGEAGTATVKITAPNNTTEDAIVVKVTLKAETASQVVTFTQLQKDAMVVDVTSYEAPAEGGKVSVKVKANVEVTATTDASWLKIATATKALVEKTFDVEVSANEGEAREGTIILSGAGKKVEVTISQAAFVPYFKIEEYEIDEEGNSYVAVPAEGGKYNFTVSTNIPYEFEPYADAFPTQHVVRDGNKYEVTIDANTTFNAIDTYVKFTVQAQDPETGEETALKIKVYFQQEALPCLAYSISMYEASFDTWGTTVISEAAFNGKHYVSNGQDLYEINPADGVYKQIDWPWGAGMTQKVITTDDAGNLIVCNHTAYIDGNYTDGYFILNVVTPDGTESNLITKAGWECGGPFGAKLKVRGDITSNAIIVAPVEGIVDITMSSTIGYWEVKDGVIGEYGKVGVTGIAGTWSCAAWNTYPNNFPTVQAQGTSAAEGFVMSGCYEDNNIYVIGADGAATVIMTPEYMEGEYDLQGNLGCQSMDIRTIGGKNYLVVLASSFFPSYGPGWSGAPIVALHEVSSITPGSNMFTSAKFCKTATEYFPWEDDPASDWAISVAADVVLYDADGKVGIAITDLNGRCIEAYAIDPAKI